MSMSLFVEIAVEEAVRLRTALAIGADRAILIESNEEPQPRAIAKLLKSLVDKEQP
ncbi:electron transfer flavoprotein alpha/beta subunit [Caballeronia udeis]|uniref:Electron transfer flavoprotein alpha/beta subunit n=1 Tax=Caballeronia udeis TaxID=1232866 RepID=A0ABW8MTL1_9BURK